jgi:hypothetical protein
MDETVILLVERTGDSEGEVRSGVPPHRRLRACRTCGHRRRAIVLRGDEVEARCLRCGGRLDDPLASEDVAPSVRPGP